MSSSSSSSSLNPIAKPSPPISEQNETPDQLNLMILGKPYIASDKYLGRIRDESYEKVYAFNRIRNTEKRMKKTIKGFINLKDQDEENTPQTTIALPFSCEYGFNITLGNEIYIGPECQFIDVCPITIGNRTMIGGSCKFYTPSHPISPEERNGGKGPEWGKPIVVGEDVWIGGSVIICPGIKIGNGSTIGAGSVVTKDIPDRVVAVGNPARVIKKILQDGTVVPVSKA
ncbi:uncharacterized protein L201_002339 [Kwoniella dendrophila CBS 6074]|uniref:Maltose O-acetyltransferase n=1 Tax=Kwoniella dendrophila CBS 6074 TaxID=1295534 RepID=A0AAX4JS82_9TREE